MQKVLGWPTISSEILKCASHFTIPWGHGKDLWMAVTQLTLVGYRTKYICSTFRLHSYYTQLYYIKHTMCVRVFHWLLCFFQSADSESHHSQLERLCEWELWGISCLSFSLWLFFIPISTSSTISPVYLHFHQLLPLFPHASQIFVSAVCV